MEKTKKAIAALLKVGNKISAALKDDGKISVGEGLGLATQVIPVIGIIGDIKAIKAELKDIDQHGIAWLVQEFKEEFDLPNDEVEEKVERGVELLGNLATMLLPKE